jgi:hypothetical protein
MDSQVVVVVHPRKTDQYWPQGPANVRADGFWKASICIGSEAEGQVGHEFELLAVANPKHVLGKTHFLDSWPAAEARSQIVRVRRA